MLQKFANIKYKLYLCKLIVSFDMRVAAML